MGSRNDGFEIRILSFQEIEDKWREFEKTAIMTPYQNYDWLKRWMEHIGCVHNTSPLLVEGYAGDKTVFILPLMLKQSFGVTICKWLGGKEQNMNAGLFDREFLLHNPEVFRKAIDRIREKHPEIALFHLEKQQPNLQQIPNSAMATGKSYLHPNSFFANEMGDDYEEWERQQRSRNSRNRMRRQWKKLEKQHNLLEVKQAQSKQDVEKVLRNFFKQRQERFEISGVPNPYANRQLQDMLVSVCKDFSTSTHGFHVHSLASGEIIHAVHLGFFQGSHYSGFCHSINGASYKHSPGILLQKEVLILAHARGIRTFDFGLGNTPYKFGWTSPVELYDNLIPVKASGYAIAAIIRFMLKSKPLIKKILKTRLLPGSMSKNALKYAGLVQLLSQSLQSRQNSPDTDRQKA